MIKRLAIICILLTIFLCSCTNSGDGTTQSTEQDNSPETTFNKSTPATATDEPQTQAVTEIGDDIPVTRAIVAKMLAAAFNNINDIELMEREIAFEDTSPDNWYDKYINAVYLGGQMLGSGETFNPEDNITVRQVQYLLDKLYSGNKIKLEIDDDSKPVSYALWLELYIRMLEDLAGDQTVAEVFGISEKNIIPLATSGNNSKLKEYFMITESGPMTHSGLSLDSYIDKELLVLAKDDEILAIKALVTDTPTIKNAYIVGQTDDTITIFTGGAERAYRYKNQLPKSEGAICDITINSEQALNITIYSEKVTGVVKRVDSKSIELDNGLLEADSKIKVYDLSDGKPKWKTVSSLIVGSDIAEYFVNDGKIVSCVVIKPAPPDKLRVAISTTGFSSLIHNSVSVTGTGSFKITAGDETTEYDAWEVVDIPEDLYGQGRIYITSSNQDGKIAITSIRRNWADNASPKYRGVIEVARDDDGFTVVNELSFEEYLYAVVPSEMPSSHGLEAAKAQAVTARSYAYNQYFANRYYRYGANVDDSVNCQVYNNIPESDISIQAVDETAGQCLTYGGAVISANFFSTSGGTTANSGEVWVNAATRQFPSETSEYLLSNVQYTEGDYGDLSQEENAKAFFKDKEVKSYDSGFNWFRWNVTMTAQEITASINATIKERYAANPNIIKTLQSNGVYRSRPVESIGTVTGLEVLSRGAGGNVMALRVIAEDTEIIIYTEYAIRTLIKPYQCISGGRDIILNRSDGSQLSNYSIMPSAFYTFDLKSSDNGALESVTFYGGGNGHGVGMSQNGVKGMIDAGFSFTEVLQHYYQGTVVKEMF